MSEGDREGVGEDGEDRGDGEDEGVGVLRD